MDGLWLAFTLGLASAASPCLLPLYPSFLAYLTANTRALEGRRASGFLGLIILGGVLTTMLAVAVILVVVAVPIGAVLGYLIPLVDGLLILLGILLIPAGTRSSGCRGPRSRSSRTPMARPTCTA